MKDNFKEYYEASKKGWAERYADHYVSDINPKGLVSVCNRSGAVGASIYPCNSDKFFDKGQPKRLLYSPQLEDAEKNLGYFDTIEEAKAVAEKALLDLEAAIKICPTCKREM